MNRLILILAILISMGWGCATTATITDQDNNIYTYKGPKNIDMSVKLKEHKEIKYSGKSEGFFEGLLKFLLMKTPDVTVIK